MPLVINTVGQPIYQTMTDQVGRVNSGLKKDLVRELLRFQIYHIAAVSDIVETMMRETISAGQSIPLLHTPPPADRLILELGSGSIVVAKRGGEYYFNVGISALITDRNRDRFKADYGMEAYNAIRDWKLIPSDKSLVIKNAGLNLFTEAGIAGFLTFLFEWMATPHFETEDVKVNRAEARRLGLKPFEIKSKNVIFTRRSYGSTHKGNETPSHTKAFHYVSGHWRLSTGDNCRMVEGQLRTWVKGHWRGDPTKGVICRTTTINKME